MTGVPIYLRCFTQVKGGEHDQQNFHASYWSSGFHQLPLWAWGKYSPQVLNTAVFLWLQLWRKNFSDRLWGQ